MLRTWAIMSWALGGILCSAEDIGNPKRTNELRQISKAVPQKEEIEPAGKAKERRPLGRSDTAVLSHLSGLQECCVSVSPFSLKQPNKGSYNGY